MQVVAKTVNHRRLRLRRHPILSGYNRGNQPVTISEIAHAPYLVMLAHTPKRVRRRAPLTWLVTNEDALRAALETVFGAVGNVQVQWLLCMQPGSNGDVVVREFLLMDSKVEGRA